MAKPSITIGKYEEPTISDRYDNILNDFKLELDALVKLNEVIPQKIKEYFISDKMPKESFTDEEISEFKNFETFGTENNDSDSKTFEFSSQKVFDAIFNSQENFIFEGRFQRFVKVNSLIFLVSEFEYFLKRTLDLTFSITPEILKTKSKTIDYESLIDTEPESVLHKILDKELDEIMLKDIQDLSKYLENTFNLFLKKQKTWDEFKERFYRRHILIHNRGQIDKKYNEKTSQDHDFHYLTVNEKYFKKSIKLFDDYSILITNFLKDKFSSKEKLKLERHSISCVRLPEEHKDFTCDPFSE